MSAQLRRKIVPSIPAWRSRQGFSLVETMIVIILVGVLATVSAPPMYQYLQSHRLQTDTDRLITDLQYARALSVSRGQVLRFVSDANGYTLSEPATGTVVRQRAFEHGIELAGNQTTQFYPWGMADAKAFKISNGCGAKQIDLLPTGIVEVQ